MVEMRKAETVQTKLHLLHNVCSQLLETLGNRGCLYIMRIELNHEIEKLCTAIQAAGSNQGTDPDLKAHMQANSNDIGRLQAKISLMQTDLAILISNTPVTTMNKQIQQLEVNLKDLQRKYETQQTQLVEMHHLKENIQSLEKDLMATNQTVTELMNFIKDQFKQRKVTTNNQPRSKLFPDVDPVTIRAASHSNPTFQQHGLKQPMEQTTTRPDSVLSM